MENLKYKIYVLGECGDWYLNCRVENGYDAKQIFRFYTDRMGYVCKAYMNDLDVTESFKSTKFVTVNTDDANG